MKKKLTQMLFISLVLAQFGTFTTYAAQNTGYGTAQGRTDVVNVNDYSNNSWDRFERNYQFESGVDYKDELGKPTQTNIVPKNTENQNVRNNKDVTFIPPAYGVFSGEFDRERTNPYITIKSVDSVRETATSIGSSRYDTLRDGVNSTSSGEMGVLMPTSISSSGVIANPSNAIASSTNTTSNTNNTSSTSSTFASNVTVSNTVRPNELNTQSIQYADGSIGTLSIPKLKVTVRVFEGETLASMKKGVGHFEFTSGWDGNIGIAGHNGGSAGYFENIRNLNIGDEIIYETKYGTRKYRVSYSEKISDTDYSKLGWSGENQITLITCVQGVANQRLAVIATEVK